MKYVQVVRNKLSILFSANVAKSAIWLFALNISNTIIPFFTFPYITRVFGPDGYGKLQFALTFIAYFIVIINYGFNLVGARNIAMVREDSFKLSKTFSSILLSQIYIFLFTLFPLIMFTIFIPSLYDIRILIWILYISVLGNTFMPVWLFHGLQKVKVMTIISVSIRILFLISVFSFVNNENDLRVYSFIYSISLLLIGITSLLYISKIRKIRFQIVSLRDVIKTLIEGFPVFISNIVIAIAGRTGILVLGLFYADKIVGYYSGASKIAEVIAMFFYPIGQALFPYCSRLYAKSFNDGYQVVIKVFRFILPVFGLITFLVVMFSDLIVKVVLGNDFSTSGNILKLLALYPILSIVSNMMGTQILVASGHTKEYGRAFIRGSVGYILFYLLFTYMFSAVGTAVAAILGELFCLLMLGIEVIKIKKKYVKIHQVV
ncbi:flippase [Bacillus sp. FJAT-29953]|nr:flippase [Bacillus sp. FJAT-29953]